jgi:hypothetical protein
MPIHCSVMPTRDRFGDLVGSHFKVSTLNNLPEHMHSLADENPNMPSMSESSRVQWTHLKLPATVTEPNKSAAVFFRVREDDCPPLLLPEYVPPPLTQAAHPH